MSAASRAALIWLAVTGCESSSARCSRVFSESAMHIATQAIFDGLREGIDSPDSIQAAYRRITAPPSPKDAEWYDNHCWHGKPR